LRLLTADKKQQPWEEKQPRQRALRQICKERDRLLEFLGVQKRLVETREPPTSSLQRGEMAEA
jgi:hypothetical protein